MWRACSTCKKPIALGARYYVCNVSTCQRPATNFVFCEIDCWDAHVPTFRHKDAWAEERTAPATATHEDEQSESKAGRISPPAPKPAIEDEVLVVVSKLKAYIHARAGMNTSNGVADVLSDKIRAWCDRAIKNAESAGRKTVLDRDVV